MNLKPLNRLKVTILFVSTFVLRLSQIGFAQESKGRIRGFEASVFSGYHFASNGINKTGESLNGIPVGLSLNWVQYGIQKKAFTDVFGDPRLNLELKITKLNNTDTFGYSLAVLPGYTYNLVQNKRVILGAKVSYGLNLNTKQYSHASNFDNRAISSPINFALDFGLNLSYNLNAYTHLTAGTGLYHVSNGSLKMPNGGINILYAQLGMTYYPMGLAYSQIKRPTYTGKSKSIYYQVYGAYAYRQIGYFNYINSFSIASLSNQVYFSFNKLYSTGLGLDAFYDASQALLYDSQKNYSEVPENQKYLIALGWCNRFEAGNFFFPLSLNHYIYPMKVIKEPVYIKFGLGYQLNKSLFTGLFFKGTLNNKKQLQSDFMEWSLGFRI